MRRSVRLSSVLLVLLLGCGGLGNVAEQVRDDDDDGWFNHEHNQATTLTLDSGVFALAGQYRFVVDGVRFPMTADLEGSRSVEPQAAGRVVSLGFPVARRVSGTALLDAPSGVMTYASTVRVQMKDPAGLWRDVGTATVSFANADATLPAVTVGTFAPVALNFSTARTVFADPDPANALNDADGDGITEVEEGKILSRAHGGIGDPRPAISLPGSRDTVLTLTWTDPASAPDEAQMEVMRSRFAFRDINLWIDDGMLLGTTGFGGLIARPAAPGTQLTPADSAAAFSARVPLGRRRFVRFVVMDPDFVSSGTTQNNFGVASGQTMVMRSHLAAPLPDIRNYQAGVMMHEFGHTMGLCHPTDVPCASGTLPPAERDPGATIMGSPAENPPIVVATGPAGPVVVQDPMRLINAMSRPIDYTPAQWTNLRVGGGFPAPGP